MGLLLLTLTACLIGGGLALAASSPSHPAASWPPAPVGGAALAAHPEAVAPLTHGDLVVNAANSPFLISPATTGSSVYVQGGNITVQAGGSLWVRNTTLDFVQFIGSSGDALQRLGHLYHFYDQGTVVFDHATLTTETQVLNAYPKLLVNASAGGALSLNSSTFAFPGWISVYGAGTLFNATSSAIEPNALVANLSENASVQRDTSYAPSLTVTGGAQAILANSSVLGLYQDNITAAGAPGLQPIDATGGDQSVDSTTAASWNGWTSLTDSENVTRDVLYPSLASGAVVFTYSASVSATSASGNSLVFGASYNLGSISFNSANEAVTVPLPANAIAAINSAGIPAFLEATGALGGSASTVTVNVGVSNQATALTISGVALVFTPYFDYNITVAGGGSVFTAVDSALGLNWNLTPGSTPPVGALPPTPWASNKLLVEQGATANLANVTITAPRTGVFWNQSAIVPDGAAGTSINFYRWSVVPVTASGDVPIPAAQLAAFYAYDSNQANNATATALNDLASHDALLWGYAASAHGSAYGVSDANGLAYLLLASGMLNQSTLPDGVFLGGYHVAVTLAGGGAGATKWGYAAVTPYPNRMDPATPDVASTFTFPTYAPFLSVGSITVSVGGVPVTSAKIGETIEVHAVVTNSGAGPVTTAEVVLGYAEPGGINDTVVAGPATGGPMPSGAGFPVDFNWTVNESVTGDLGTFNATFDLLATWNGGASPNGGTSTQPFSLTIAPSDIAVSFTAPHQTLNFAPESYTVSGTVTFNGTGQAELTLVAIDAAGNVYVLGSTEAGASQSSQGTFLIAFAVEPSMPAGVYAMQVNASYNGRTATANDANAFTIAGAAAAAPSFLDQTFLGLKVLYWILIALGVVVAIIAALFLLRSTARGKLVECGECGQLIPEDATTCPKCGAEFETELVRCSRCGSTIPANSQVCPECAAQLIGKPEEAARDPERQGYNDFVERFRAESKKELGDNYSEGAFWDWWKRQPTYLPFSQWKLQQQQGSRAGMSAPPADAAPSTTTRGAQGVPPKRPPPRGGGGAAPPAAVGRAPVTPARSGGAPAPTAPATAGAPAAAGTAQMKPCSNCGREIPPDYLVCPFCGAVTQ